MNDLGARGRRLGAVALLLLAAACTSGTTNGSGTVPSGSSSGRASSGGASSSAGPAVAPKPRITGLNLAWVSQPLGAHVKDALTTRLNSISTDTHRVYTMGELARSGDLIDHPTRVSAADLRTGRPVWAVTLPGSNVEMLALPTVIAVAVYNRNATLYGLDPATGRTLWLRKDLGSSDESPVAALGTELFATYDTDESSGLARLDPLTGRIVAHLDALLGDAALSVVAGTLIAVGFDGIAAYTTDLRAQKWHAKASDSPAGFVNHVVGTALLRIPVDGGVVQALDVATGRRRWQRKLPYNYGDEISFAGGLAYFHSNDVMTAVDASRGTTVWAVASRSADYVGAGADAGNLLACGLALVSAESANAAPYRVIDLPKLGFAQDGCEAPPIATAAASVAPGLVVVMAPTAVYAYTATTTDSPRAGLDPLGRWGRADPAVCGVDGAATRTALTAQFGGRWVLGSADNSHDCEWVRYGVTPRLTAQTVPLTTPTAARNHLDPGNPYGGCVRFGTGGKESTIAATGLPAGSGACLLTHYTDPIGGKLPDAVTGVTERGGKYFAVLVEGFRYGTAAATRGPQKVVALLRALAR